jgi:hypothetical protein
LDKTSFCAASVSRRPVAVDVCHFASKANGIFMKVQNRWNKGQYQMATAVASFKRVVKTKTIL